MVLLYFITLQGGVQRFGMGDMGCGRNTNNVIC